nr:uncharacterized protein LOC112544786 [Pelodiscus sinensis]|eukprot:XP_025037410.1 uncharacterized protein LOC112544786 [Pelodiscus sinensis]
MLLSLCLLLPALSPSSQEICSAPGTLRAPILYLSQTSARLEDSVQLKCSVFSQNLAARVIFCKDGEEVSSQTVSVGKFIYDFNHVMSRSSSGNYSCGYEIKDSENQVTRSQLSPAQPLSISAGTAPEHPDFTHGNIARLELAVVVLLVLGLILAEDYYSHPRGGAVGAWIQPCREENLSSGQDTAGTKPLCPQSPLSWRAPPPPLPTSQTHPRIEALLPAGCIGFPRDPSLEVAGILLPGPVGPVSAPDGLRVLAPSNLPIHRSFLWLQCPANQNRGSGAGRGAKQVTLPRIFPNSG